MRQETVLEQVHQRIPEAIRELPLRAVPIRELLLNEDVRKSGVDEGHARVLADCVDVLPPILVQEKTGRVIDGMHRLRAAELRGDLKVTVRLLDVDDDSAYLQGVAANITHGLPLTLSDRKRAAQRVLRLHPEWSDRAIARAAGLSGKTVAALRGRSAGALPEPERRVGLDGRERPVDATTGRGVAEQLLAARPGASLRDIAKKAGISSGTVRRVRDALQRQQQDPAAGQRRGEAHALVNPDAVLQNLRQDPSLRYRVTGRRLLQVLHHRPAQFLTPHAVASIPARWRPTVSALARHYAREWLDLAESLEAVVGRPDIDHSETG